MKRIYLKPEIKPLRLRLTTFLTAGSGPDKDPVYGIDDDDIGNAGKGDESRSFRQSMWDDMD